jgi:hypothetical protein
MPVDLRCRLDVGDVAKGLEGLAAFGRDPAAAFRDLKKPLRVDQRDHGKQQEGPEGKWPARARQPGRRRARGGRRRLLGKLTRAIKGESDRLSVRAFGRARWSGAHQDGAVIGRGAQLPQREHLWLSPEFMEAAQATFEEHMLGSFFEGL